jgi:probable HAF family extracellular repeat protein
MKHQYGRGRRAMVLGAAFAMVLITVIGIGAPVAVAKQAWEVIDLGVLPGGSFSNAYKISDNGFIAGASGVYPGRVDVVDVVRWNPDGQMMDLGSPAGGYSAPTGINGNGEVSGFTTPVGDLSQTHAVRWNSAGQVTWLGSLPGYSSSVAVGIADDGTAAGNLVGPPSPYAIRAVRWTADGRVMDLGTLPGGTDSTAVAINAYGDVVGTSTTADGSSHAVWWDSDGRITDLGANTDAWDINDRDEIAGYLNGRPVRWDAKGNVTVLGELSSPSYLDGLNNHGITIGHWLAGQRAVRWDVVGQITILEGLLGFVETTAAAINDNAEVVGTSYAPGGETRAVFWDRQGVVADLGVLPVHDQSSGNNINNHGDVIGASSVNGWPRAVLWRRR